MCRWYCQSRVIIGRSCRLWFPEVIGVVQIEFSSTLWPLMKLMVLCDFLIVLSLSLTLKKLKKRYEWNEGKSWNMNEKITPIKFETSFLSHRSKLVALIQYLFSWLLFTKDVLRTRKKNCSLVSIDFSNSDRFFPCNKSDLVSCAFPT